MKGKDSSTSTLKVSVIIPLYNKEEYIARCLQSVMNQTYQNIECIIVNDASTDNSLQISEKELKGYKGHIPFYILQHDKNRGLSAARNTGIDHAVGDYIEFLDADDELTPNSVNALIDKAMEYPGIDIVQGNVQAVPHHNDYYELRRFNFPDLYSDNESIRIRYFNLWKDFPVNAWAKLIRTNYIKENKLYFMENIIHEDYHWTIKMVRTAKSMSFVYDYVYIRYFVPNSIITTTNHEKSAKHFGLLLNDVVCTIDQKDYLRQFRKFLLVLTNWMSLAPHDKTLKKTSKLFARIASDKHWYNLTIILTLNRWIQKNKRGDKFAMTLIYWWLNHNK